MHSDFSLKTNVTLEKDNTTSTRRIRKFAPHDMMYDHTYSKIMDQPGKVAASSPARGQLNRKNEYLPVHVVRA